MLLERQRLRHMADASADRPLLYLWSGLGAHFGAVTGVGRHAKNMGLALAADPGWDTRIVLARDQADPVPEDWNGVAPPVMRLPLARAEADLAWSLLARPAIERWLEGRGWLYCPKEKYVPVRDLRYAVTIHDIYAFESGQGGRGPAEALRRRRFAWMIDRADVILAVSHFTKVRLIDRFGLEAGRIAVVGNGVEEAYFAAASLDPEACRAAVGGRYVLFVGGLRRKKGASDILRFADALAKVDPALRVLVVGTVEPEFAGEIGSRRNLEVMARGVADAEMARLVRGASVAVSLSAYEGFGIPLLEAMAAGVPVVAAARAALPEVLGEAGILVEPADACVTAGIVHDLVRDECLRGAYVARGRRRAERFRWPACAARVSRALSAYDCGQKLC